MSLPLPSISPPLRLQRTPPSPGSTSVLGHLSQSLHLGLSGVLLSSWQSVVAMGSPVPSAVPRMSSATSTLAPTSIDSTVGCRHNWALGLSGCLLLPALCLLFFTSPSPTPRPPPKPSPSLISCFFFFITAQGHAFYKGTLYS